MEMEFEYVLDKNWLTIGKRLSDKYLQIETFPSGTKHLISIKYCTATKYEQEHTVTTLSSYLKFVVKLDSFVNYSKNRNERSRVLNENTWLIFFFFFPPIHNQPLYVQCRRLRQHFLRSFRFTRTRLTWIRRRLVPPRGSTLAARQQPPENWESTPSGVNVLGFRWSFDESRGRQSRSSVVVRVLVR